MLQAACEEKRRGETVEWEESKKTTEQKWRFDANGASTGRWSTLRVRTFRVRPVISGFVLRLDFIDWRPFLSLAHRHDPAAGRGDYVKQVGRGVRGNTTAKLNCLISGNIRSPASFGGVLWALTRWKWILPSFMGSCLISLDFTGFHRLDLIELNFIVFFWISLDLWLLLVFSWFNEVWLGFTGY